MSVENDKNKLRGDNLRGSESWRSWYSHEPLPTYMREVGDRPLLTLEEEKAWSKQYQDARERIRGLIQEHPQVILSKLHDLYENQSKEELSNYLALAHQEEDDSFEDTIDLEVGDRLSNVESDLLNKILENSSELIHGYIQGLSETGNQSDNGVKAVAEIIAPYIRSHGKVQFQQRFYKECVELFMSGQWEEKGLSAEKKSALCNEMREAIEREHIAMNALVEGNLRLVISVAKRFSGTFLPLSDLVQEGNIGLMRAIENFDWLRGHRLSTYACYCIRQAISRALSTNGRPIRIPVNILRQLSKIRRCEQAFIQENNIEPTDDQLAEVVGITPARLRALKRMEYQPISLQSMATEDRDWNDLLADKNTPAPSGENRESKDILCESLRQALDTLTDNERDILIRRFGLYGQPIQSLKVISERYNLTCERIRQIEAGALLKLRRTHGTQFRDNE